MDVGLMERYGMISVPFLFGVGGYNGGKMDC